MKREQVVINEPKTDEYVILDCLVKVKTGAHELSSGSMLFLAQVYNVCNETVILCEGGETEGEAMRKLARKMRDVADMLLAAAGEIVQEFGNETTEDSEQ